MSAKPAHASQPRRITGWSAGLRPASRGSAKPAPTTPPPTNLTPANPRIANRAESRGKITGWSAGLRPASRGSAKPAPTTPPPANLTPTNPRIANRAESRGGAPVSDRHRAGARNPHQRPRPPPISRLQTHASPTAQNHGTWSAGLRPASRGSAKPAPTTPPPANLTPTNPRIANRAESRDMERRSPTGIARQRETRTNDPAPPPPASPPGGGRHALASGQRTGPSVRGFPH